VQVFDGSLGEGGGSILRLVTSLAIITQDPVKIVNIRKNRPKPGLQTQHLEGIRALVKFCGGELEGDYLGSETILFTPANSWRSHLKVNITTAGSIGLILQSLQMAILGVKNHTLKVEIQGGGTFGKWAPSVPYVNHVTWEIFRKMNYELKLNIIRHGFYPKGGARVSIIMRSPSSLRGLSLIAFKKPKHATIMSYESKHLQRAQVAKRQADAIAKALKGHEINSHINQKYVG
jgi:RNA 3'-terminal phosphate cyclase (ATP)/RNA 3'-terminal phosphate cyclase (GTP)